MRKKNCMTCPLSSEPCQRATCFMFIVMPFLLFIFFYRKKNDFFRIRIRRWIRSRYRNGSSVWTGSRSKWNGSTRLATIYLSIRMMASDNGGPMLSPIYDKQQQSRLPPAAAEIPAVGEFLDSSKDRYLNLSIHLYLSIYSSIYLSIG